MFSKNTVSFYLSDFFFFYRILRCCPPDFRRFPSLPYEDPRWPYIAPGLSFCRRTQCRAYLPAGKSFVAICNPQACALAAHSVWLSVASSGPTRFFLTFLLFFKDSVTPSRRPPTYGPCVFGPLSVENQSFLPFSGS